MAISNRILRSTPFLFQCKAGCRSGNFITHQDVLDKGTIGCREELFCIKRGRHVIVIYNGILRKSKYLEYILLLMTDCVAEFFGLLGCDELDQHFAVDLLTRLP